ncbi:MAG: PAS domain S-box protein [Flavobacterium sp.]|nr:PAS domain S-box protein [Flavobacterium sp.]
MKSIQSKILIIEHDSDNTELINNELKKSKLNYISEIVKTKKEYIKSLHIFQPDIILSNYAFPTFDGPAAFKIKEKLSPQTPFIFVSESVGEEIVVELIKNGVSDFVLRESLSSTLCTKMNQALKKAIKCKLNSETKQAEEKRVEKLGQNEAKFRAIFENSIDGILLLVTNGEILAANTALCKMLQKTEQEIIKSGKYGFADINDPIFKVFLEEHKRTGKAMGEPSFKRKDGSKFPGEISSVVFTDANGQEKTLMTIKDITERKSLEKAFEIEKQRFLDLYSQAPSCMGILKGANHVFEMANPLYLQLIDKKDIIGKTVKEVLPEMIEQGIFEILDTVYQTGETFSANEMLIKFDYNGNGKLVDTYLNFIYQAHRNTDGDIDGIFFFANNVTEQVLSSHKIEESKKMYEELIQNLPLATYSCDADGKIVIYNKAAVALWGREPEIGKDLWCGAFNAFNLKNNRIEFNSYRMIGALKEGKQVIGEELIIERPNGEKRNVMPYPVAFVNPLGEITGAVNVLTDITEIKIAEKALKESEKKYRQIVETSQEGIWVIDENHKTSFVNKKMEEILDYTKEEIMGKEIDFFMDEEGKQLVAKSIIRKTKEQSSQRQFKYISKSGKEIWANVATNPFIDSKGIYKGSMAMVSDITEREKNKEKLELLNKELAFQNEEKENRAAELFTTNTELVKTNRELDRFVYSVSHDLRSPLTSILGLVSFIEEESLEEDTLEHIGMIRNSVNRLDEFIKNILSYSRNNRTGLDIVQIPLQKTATEIVDSLRSIKGADDIHFEVDIKEEEPFFSDMLRMNTLLENLISNAIKYHKTGQTNNYIKIVGHSDPEKLFLSISDNGIGIAHEHHNKIFDMFFRISGNKNGSGIGLYIVKETVQILHGTIQVFSEEGKGTKFNITLKNLKP